MIRLKPTLTLLCILIFGVSASYANSDKDTKSTASPIPKGFACTEDELEENPYIVKGENAQAFMSDGVCSDNGELTVNACYIEINSDNTTLSKEGGHKKWLFNGNKKHLLEKNKAMLVLGLTQCPMSCKQFEQWKPTANQDLKKEIGCIPCKKNLDGECMDEE